MSVCTETVQSELAKWIRHLSLVETAIVNGNATLPLWPRKSFRELCRRLSDARDYSELTATFDLAAGAFGGWYVKHLTETNFGDNRESPASRQVRDEQARINWSRYAEVPDDLGECREDERVFKLRDRIRRLREQLQLVAGRLVEADGPPIVQNDKIVRPDCVHSADFRSVVWFGRRFTFTATQAACVRVLWEHWEQGTPAVSGAAILTAADAAHKRFDLVFRKSKAWKTMIVKAESKGAYRLADLSA